MSNANLRSAGNEVGGAAPAENTGSVTRQQWKWSALAGMASYLDAGSIVALVLAMALADHFWIANAIFLGGMAAALVSSVTKIAAYHGPFQRW